MRISHFSNPKSFDELKAEVLKNRWAWNQERYDRGSDFVTFEYGHTIVGFNIIDGSFFAKKGNDCRTEKSSNRLDEPWFKGLIKFLYKNVQEVEIVERKQRKTRRTVKAQ